MEPIARDDAFEEVRRLLFESRDRLVQLEAEVLELRQLVHEVRRLEEEASVLRSALDAIRRSESWRVTRPLRALAQFLRREHS